MKTTLLAILLLEEAFPHTALDRSDSSDRVAGFVAKQKEKR
jgi:hypothetical protein